MAVTLKTIGLKAGVSVATVSRVLNGSTNSKIPIGKQARDRVLAIAEELNYVPNRMAQAMRTQKTNNIGVVFSRDLTVSVTADLFYMQILSRVEELILDRGYNIVLSGIPAGDIEKRINPSIVVQGMVDALIVLRVSDADYLEGLRDVCPSTLLLDRTSPVVDCVSSDNRGGMRLAVEHLHELGHRHIGYIDSLASMNDSSFRDRFHGYHQTMKSVGLTNDERFVVRSDAVGEGGCEALGRLLKQAPHTTAVICANDNIAIHAMRYCQNNGVSIPHDISIVGFDDIETSRHLTPALTTVAVDKRAMGEHAVSLLFERLDEKTKQAPQPVTKTVGVQLAVRQSTCPPSSSV